MQRKTHYIIHLKPVLTGFKFICSEIKQTLTIFLIINNQYNAYSGTFIDGLDGSLLLTVPSMNRLNQKEPATFLILPC
jgi:hypothetical protein